MIASSFTIAGEPGQPALEGEWLGTGSLVAIVAPPHPLMGGDLSNPVVRAVADGLHRGGLRCLLFNWRGVGESYGDPSGDPGDADADYRAAIAAATAVAPPLVLSGYSFGGATALRVGAGHPIAHLLAIAPPPGLLPDGLPEGVARRTTIVAGERDTIAPAAGLLTLLERTPGAGLRTFSADHFFGGCFEALRDASEQLAQVVRGP